MKTEEEYFREKYPDRAKKADSGSRKQAIFNHCAICIGDGSAKACTSKTCSLYPYRCVNAKKK
tara:strand:- start:4080 stop:4268 length:189 start_codon:yes stop_codon:yes gene_type:complete